MKINIFLFIVTIALFIFPNVTEGETKNKHNNAIWMEHTWVADYYESTEITHILSIIESHDINTVYINVGLLNSDGTMHYPNFLWHFLKYAKLHNDSLKAIAWINGNSESTDISQDYVRNNIADVCSVLVFGSQWAIDNGYTYFFDGVQINIEPVPGGNQDYVTLLDSIKCKIGNEKILCTAGLTWSEKNSKWTWNSTYYDTISDHVDQIAVMTYNSGPDIGGMNGSDRAYIEWIKEQVTKITNAVKQSEDYIYFAVTVLDSTRECENNVRLFTNSDPRFENIENGLIGINDALSDTLSDTTAVYSVFAGVSIYIHCEIDTSVEGLDEWDLYERFWIGRPFSDSLLVLAHYLPWYADNNYSEAPRRHWENGYVDTAIIGEYDSRDSKLIEYHVLQAYSLGIDGFSPNWYGKDKYEDIAFDSLINKVNEMNTKYSQLDFKVCISVDESTGVAGWGDVEWQEQFDYIANKYLKNPDYLWYDNRPVIFIFNYDNYPDAWDYRKFCDNAIIPKPLIIWNESQKEVFNYVDVCYPWVQPYANKWDPEGKEWGEKYLVDFYWRVNNYPNTGDLLFICGGVWPGFDDRMCDWGKNRWMDRQKGKVYKSTWNFIHDYPQIYPQGLTLLWAYIETWNDWNEGTEIEPSLADGYQYIQATKDNVREYKQKTEADTSLHILVPQHIYQARVAIEKGRVDYSASSNMVGQAINEFLNGKDSLALSLSDKAAGIPAPKFKIIDVGDDFIKIDWDSVSNATGYKVYYSKYASAFNLFSTDTLDKITITDSTKYKITDLEQLTTYHIAVTSFDTSLGLFANESYYFNILHTATILDTTTTPVELSFFTAYVEGNEIEIKWNTATETNNYGFEIERSIDKVSFIKIGFVEGHRTTLFPHEFNFVDKNLIKGVYYYRLKQINMDGSFEYSDIIEVSINIPTKYLLKQNIPNPFNSVTIINYQTPTYGKVEIKIYNLMGQEIKTLLAKEKDAGYHFILWDGRDNANKEVVSGIYIYRMKARNFIQSSKMIMSK